MINILIGGDVCPIGRALPFFVSGNVEQNFSDIIKEFSAADFNVVNLECCLIEKNTPIDKDGPVLGVPVACVNGLKKLRVNAVNFANNHCLDHGETGLKKTLEALNKSAILCFGAGMNLQDAGRMIIVNIKDKRIAFLGYAEHEFSIAGIRSGGANPLDITDFIDKLNKYRNKYDFLIVLLHAGKEYYPYPSPRLAKLCHFFAEQGANAIICQHSHCVGCFEIYKGVPIVYGQGNLIFDRPTTKKYWHQGVLVRLKIDDNLKTEVELVPYFQFTKDFPGVKILDLKGNDFMEQFYRRSRDIIYEEFIEQKWIEHCIKEKYTYFSRLYGHNRILRKLNKIFHFTDWVYSKEIKLMIRNVVECESHREVLETLWRLEH